MRKATVLLLLFLLITVLAVSFLTSGVYAAHDQVELRQEVIIGDASMVDDVALHIRTHYDNHLFWETSYRPGTTPQARTDYRFSAEGEYEPWVPFYDGVRLESYLEAITMYGIEDSPLAESAGIAQAFHELAKDTGAGEEKSREIYLKDYMDYYPISVNFSFADIGWSLDMDTFVDDEDLLPGRWAYDARALQDYFKFPILDDERLTISVAKNADGNTYRTSLGSGGESSDTFHLYTTGDWTEEACYFTFDAISEKGTVVDLSHLPDGFGIFRIPRNTDPNVQSPVVSDELTMAFPLDPAVTIHSLSVSPEEDRLLLYTTENDLFHLTVIDIETMEPLQKLELTTWTGEWPSYVIYEEEGFIAFFFDMEDQLIVLERDEDGLYRFGLHTPFRHDQAPNFAVYELSVDFDGERLVVTKFLPDAQYGTRDTCDFLLAVFDDRGMAYYGEYTSSLSTGVNVEQYAYHCRKMDNDPITVQWTDDR